MDEAAGTLVWLTADQMREVDRVAIEEFGVDLVRMMENAGRGLADLVGSLFGAASVTVLAGTGGNGGGGMVAARHLHNRGVAVTVTLSKPDGLRGVPAQQRDILVRMGVPILEHPVEAAVVIDALVGYSLSPPLTGRVAELVEWTNRVGVRVVALDTPSGLDVTTGQVLGPVVRADATLTLAMPKIGLRAADEVGELHLADISVPIEVYRRMGLESVETPFPGSAVVRVTDT